MIPKIIHYCWFGRKAQNEKIINYINSWIALCPEYKIIEWNEDNFPINDFEYAKEAYYAKKYAFVADVCRLYVLSKYGGIYLDTDIRLLKSLDEFLNCHSFIGKESPFMVSTAVIGSEIGCNWLCDFLKTYKDRHFISYTGSEKKETITKSLTNFFNRSFPKYCEELIVYDVDYFCAHSYYNKGEYLITENTVAVHEFSGSWKEPFSLSDRIKNVLFLLRNK